MKKLFLLSIITISILLLFFFLTKTDQNSIIDIIPDNKPYKIKPLIAKSANKNTNFAIYDTLNNKKSITSVKILSEHELPIVIKDFNNIDRIIDNIVDQNQLNQYKQIKISINTSQINTQRKMQHNSKNCHYYILDLGTFSKKQQALDQIKNLTQIYPNSKDLYQIQIQNHNEHLLHNLSLKVNNFNTAIKICQEFVKYHENCTIVELKE